MYIRAVAEFAEVEAREPVRLAALQRTCRLSAATQLLLLVPAIILVLAPFLLLTAEAIAEPATRERLSSAPLNALGAAVGVAIWVFMFGNPAWKALRRLNWHRRIDITASEALIEDRHLLGRRIWSEPLANYRGLSHHVRTTLSGTRHEVILVHPNASASLLVAMADTIGAERVEQLAARLGVPVLASGMLFRRQETGAERGAERGADTSLPMPQLAALASRAA